MSIIHHGYINRYLFYIVSVLMQLYSDLYSHKINLININEYSQRVYDGNIYTNLYRQLMFTHGITPSSHTNTL